VPAPVQFDRYLLDAAQRRPFEVMAVISSDLVSDNSWSDDLGNLLAKYFRGMLSCSFVVRNVFPMTRVLLSSFSSSMSA
jgi:hypothetical protein